MNEMALIKGWIRRWWWTPVVAVGFALLVALVYRPPPRIELTQEVVVFRGGHGWWHFVDLERSHVHAILRTALRLESPPGRQAPDVSRLVGVSGVGEIELRYESWPRRVQLSVTGCDEQACRDALSRAVGAMARGARFELERNIAEATAEITAEMEHLREQIDGEERRLEALHESLVLALSNDSSLLLALLAVRDARMRSAIAPGRSIGDLRNDVKQGLQSTGIDALAAGEALADERCAAAWRIVARITDLERLLQHVERRLDYCQSMKGLEAPLLQPHGDPVVRRVPPPPPWRRAATIALVAMAAIFVLTLWLTSRRLLRSAEPERGV